MPKDLAHLLPPVIGTRLKHDLVAGDEMPVNGQVLVLNGCAQQVSTAHTNRHFFAMLGNHGITVKTIAEESCCGSLDLHLGDEAAAIAKVKRNIDAIFPLLDQVEAVVSTASGCGVTLKDYPRLMASDETYAEKAQAVGLKTVDVSEYLHAKDVSWAKADPGIKRIAWHSPCTLQHGQKIVGPVEQMLVQAGYELTEVKDSHLCCGSAGTYSALQPEISNQLKSRKLAALQSDSPQLIATANVGYQSHLGGESQVPVKHWIELLK